MLKFKKQNRDCLRFLWVENVDDENSSINVYRFSKVVFGVNCSPFLLNAVLRYHISSYKEIDSDTGEKLTRSFYFDDLVMGNRDRRWKKSLLGCKNLLGS